MEINWKDLLLKSLDDAFWFFVQFFGTMTISALFLKLIGMSTVSGLWLLTLLFASSSVMFFGVRTVKRIAKSWES